MTLREHRKKLTAQLRALKAFTNTATVRKLRHELLQRLQRIEAKIAAQERAVRRPTSKKNIRRATNSARAGKMRRYHNYIKQIRDNYPDLTYKQIRRQLTERKHGKHTKIPDVVWQNPSP